MTTELSPFRGTEIKTQDVPTPSVRSFKTSQQTEQTRLSGPIRSGNYVRSGTLQREIHAREEGEAARRYNDIAERGNRHKIRSNEFVSAGAP